MAATGGSNKCLRAALLLGVANFFFVAAAAAQTVTSEDAKPSAAKADTVAKPASIAKPSDSERGSLDQEVVISGYRAEASTSATGIATSILNTPMSISTMTDKFLKDTGSADLMEAIGSLSGVIGQNNSGEVSTNFGVRGFAVAPQVDGFSTLSIAGGLGSSVGVERVEVLKGPSAVFNGNVPPGGTINIIYKRPSFKAENYVEAVGGSWNYRSAELFSTGSLFGSDKIAYLVNGYYKDSDGWVNYTGVKERAAILGLRFDPTDTLRFDVSFRRVSRDVHASTLPVSHEGYIGSGAPYTQTVDAWVAQNYGPNEPPQTITVPQYLPDGRRDNLLGPQNYTKGNLWLYGGGVHFTPSDAIEIRDTFMYQKFTWNLLAIVQSGAKVIGADGRSSILSSLLAGSLKGEGWENKLEAVAHFDTGPISHQLLAGFQLARSWTDHYRIWVGPPAFDSQGLPWDYATDGPRMLGDEFAALLAANPAPLIGQGKSTKVHTHSFYVAEQASALDGRLRAVIGGRYTKTATGDFYNDAFTPQAAILFKPFPKDSAFANTSVFVNYSRSFTPSGLVDPTVNKAVPPSKGIGKEIGVKTAWLGGKLTSTISVFNDELKNIPTPDYSQQQNGIVTYHLGGVGRVKGAEGEINWTVNRNLQLTANYTYLPYAKYVAYLGVPQMVGLRFGSTPRNAVNFTARYLVTDGELAGTYFGGWLHNQSRTQGVLGGDWQYAVHIPSQTDVDLFLGHTFKKLDFRLNVKNALNRKGYLPNNAFQAEPARSFLLTARFTP
jgi:iron complex outermembrane receptor protein